MLADEPVVNQQRVLVVDDALAIHYANPAAQQCCSRKAHANRSGRRYPNC